LLLGACGGASPPAVPPVEQISHGRFQRVVLVAPASPTDPAAPLAVVLLLSGDDGWTAAATGRAAQLAGRGALVIGIDLAQFEQALNGDGGQCLYPDGDLENLSHFVQAYRHLPGYLPPMVAGIDAGATLAHDTLVQAPRGTFSGGMGVGMRPDRGLTKPLCAASGKDPPAPWQAVASVPDTAWTTAFDQLAATARPAPGAAPPASLRDLPLVEIAPTPGAHASDTLAILLSGDGGWAGLDKEVAAALAADGIAVVGVDSLRYFWTPRTPQGVAADLDRLVGFYTTAWQRPRVLLIGYSQGADVLPFAVNRMSAASRAHVVLMAVLGLSPHALFEFHLSNWLGDDNAGPATLPEMNRIGGMPVVCIYGTDESDSLCPSLDPRRFTLVGVRGGHHFDGDYAALARQILAAARP
jgi:type IV secretory pathway VirJ component